MALGWLTPEFAGKWLILAFLVALVWLVRRSHRQLPKLRKIPGFQVFDEALGRCAELGRPVLFTSGASGMANETVGSFPMLAYVTRGAARLCLELLVPVCDAGVYPIQEAIVREGYAAEGQTGLYHAEQVRYIPDQNVYAVGTAGWIERAKAGATFLLGWFGYESLIIAEGGVRAGAYQIGGSSIYFQMPFFICTCDYVVIGEEYYAASAYLSQEPAKVASLVAQDWLKLALWAVGIAGALWHSIQALSR